MKRNDFILILCILLISVSGFLSFYPPNANIARISVDGKLYRIVNLDENQVIDINGTNHATVKDGEIYMSYAECPDKLCRLQGKMRDNSKTIVCLPNKIVIEAEKEGPLDAVIR